MIKPLLFVILCTAAMTFGCVSAIKHNQNLAAEAAQNFAVSAFVDQDFKEAVLILKDEVSIDTVRAKVETLHRSGNYPVSVNAVAYEPVPGTETMKIYLEGQGKDRSYHYLAVMAGTEPKGYKLSRIGRSEDPFPGSNNIKPLR